MHTLHNNKARAGIQAGRGNVNMQSDKVMDGNQFTTIQTNLNEALLKNKVILLRGDHKDIKQIFKDISQKHYEDINTPPKMIKDFETQLKEEFIVKIKDTSKYARDFLVKYDEDGMEVFEKKIGLKGEKPPTNK